MKLSVSWIPGWSLLMLCAAVPCPVRATGGWVPNRFLDEGGEVLKDAPVFYWDIELARLAEQYAGKDLPPRYKADPAEKGGQSAVTAIADNADFEDALKEDKLKPSNPAAARAAQEEMRAWLQKGATDQARSKLQEAESEFADYHKGAVFLADGKVEEAKGVWEKLLKRPVGERHYRTVWAAFMLGKISMKDGKTRSEAISWFAKCRQYAREGFADSLNLAADSIGWQARVEYDSGDRPAAARHYLQQLALGDSSAIASLKLLVPDRETSTDLIPLSFASLDNQRSEDEYWSPPELTEQERDSARAKAEKEMIAAAKDEVLRQIVSAHILCSISQYRSSSSDNRLTAWLGTVEKAKLDHVEGSASLGWAAYSAGKFAEAKRWALLDKAATPLAQWLLAKLELRDGNFAAASRIMAAVVPQLPDDAATRYDDGYLPRASASADLGASLLAQGKLKESLAAFWSGGCWSDAAYVAEHLLTTDELLVFVKENAMLSDEERSHPSKRAESSDGEGDPAKGMHWDMKNRLMDLAGRRLIREDRNAEGRALLGREPRECFDQFRELGAKGRDERNPKPERGKALFEAAQILEDGSSWCGTEDDVQRADWGGYAPEHPEAIVRFRQTGKSQTPDTGVVGEKPEVIVNFVPSSESERKRLSQIHAPRKQYVHQAAALAVQAAGLLPDNTEETADVLNQAGRWIQDLDNPGADKIYFQIEKRCPATRIGKAVIAKHWFIEPDGPWTGGRSEDGSTKQSLDELPH